MLTTKGITMPYDDIINALNDVTMRDNKEKIFIEVLNLRAYVARLQARVTELEATTLVMAKLNQAAINYELHDQPR